MSIDISTDRVPQNPAQRRVWIIAQLRMKGTSLRKLALREGVTPQAMSTACLTASSHLQAVIAEAIGLPVHRLFPEFFDDNGARIGWTRDPQRITGGDVRNVKKDETPVNKQVAA